MGKTDRYIAHLDINCFYAAVQMLLEPDLRHVPLAICGSEEDRHGIVLTANYIAKKQYHIKTGMAAREARGLCKKLVCRPPNGKQILRFSAKARNIVARYTDRIESFGLDEMWFDLTGIANSFDEATAIVTDISDTVKFELGITVSIGLSFNKIYAKLGSDYKKPDAITRIDRENYQNVVFPLPASDLLYVGPKTTYKLMLEGINTIGDLAMADTRRLKTVFGIVGEQLWVYAGGRDISPVDANNGTKIQTVGNSQTAYRELVNDYDVWRWCLMLAESVAYRLQQQGLRCRGVEFYARVLQGEVRYGGTRQGRLKIPTSNAYEIAKAAYHLFKTKWLRDYGWSHSIRAIGVRAIDLVDSTFHRQLDMFVDEKKLQKLDDLDAALFDLRTRYNNPDIVKPAVLYTEQKLSKISPSKSNIFVPPGHKATG